MDEANTLEQSALVYIPTEWRGALARNAVLPDQAEGAALFADVSGFTALAEALADALGLRRGAEELPRYLNHVYDSLITEVDRFGGSVVSFAGDAITCWFDDAMDAANNGTERACACAQAMQAAMQALAELPLPKTNSTLEDFPEISLAVKISVASGPARRFRVGDPQYRRFAVLAGETLRRMAAGEHLAARGEIILDAATISRLGSAVQVGDWLESEGERYALLQSYTQAVSPAIWPELPAGSLSGEMLRSWLLPAVYERLAMGMGEFLTELRPATVLFLRFLGIDYDNDPAAGEKLDEFVRQVQGTIAACDGTMVDVIIGDKGAYLYISFGAPVAHEDDPRRAVASALALRAMCTDLGFLHPVQIGVNLGTMRTGAYGGRTRRSYGVLGDDVNLAARLMNQAGSDEILISGRVQKAIVTDASLAAHGLDFTFDPRAPVQLKGKSEPVAVFAITGTQQRRAIQLQEPTYTLPMIGREAEMRKIETCLDKALDGHGQVVGITAEAGMGKSRLVAEVIRAARRKGFTGYGGACQSDGINTPYLVWRPIWRAIFDVNPDAPLRRQVRNLEGTLEDLAPDRVDALPLLGPLLGLPLAENDFTEALEPKDRRAALEAMLIDCMKAVAEEQADEDGGLLLVLEDLHWVDPASHELLERAARAVVDLPILILLAYRPHEQGSLKKLRLDGLAHFTELPLGELGPAEAEGAIRAKLAQLYPEWRGAVPKALIERVINHAQGNPFFAEELLNYLHDRDFNLHDSAAVESLDLPASLHSLVLSRIDQLTTHQQLTIKVAAIIGRLFRFDHLRGYYPTLGEREPVKRELDSLAVLDLTPLDNPEPELSYLFKHIITHEVAYENLPVATRSMLHEQYGRYLEWRLGDAVEAYLDVLAYHYDLSENLPKKREYLRRAGLAAAARYANPEARDYLTRALALVPEEEQEERYQLLLAREKVLDMLAERGEQQADLTALGALADEIDLEKPGPWRARVALRLASFCETTGDYPGSLAAAQKVINIAQAKNDPLLEAEGYSARGWALYRQGEHASARTMFGQGLALIGRAMGEETGAADSAGTEGIRALCLYRIGACCAEAADFNSGMPYAEEALKIYQSLGDRRGEGTALTLIGMCARGLGATERVLSCYERALRIDHELGDRRGESVRLGNLGSVLIDTGDLSNARAHLEKALKLAREINDRMLEAYWLYWLGDVDTFNGLYTKALEDYGASLSIFQAIGSQSFEVSDWFSLAGIYWRLGDYPKAAEHAWRSLEISRNIELGWAESWTQAWLAQIAVSEGAITAAEGYADEAVNTAEAVEDPGVLGFAQIAQGTVLEAQGNLGPAAEVYAQAREALRGLGQGNMQYRNLEMEALSGVLRVSGRPDGGLEELLAHIERCPLLYFAFDPLKIYLTAIRRLQAVNDSRASALLACAREMIQSRAEAISDAEVRKQFLESVATNREIIQFVL